MKMKILSCILINCVFVLSSTFCSDTFCSDVFITTGVTNIHKSAISYCINNDNVAFLGGALNWPTFNIPKEYNISPGFHKYVTTTDLNSISEQLPTWYSIIGYCKSFFILNESYYSLLKDISYESLPNSCKKLLSGNIKELKKRKCDIKVAQKLSVLTAINTSWEDALSAMKEIVGKNALSHNYTLTEALFILHLKPSRSCINN